MIVSRSKTQERKEKTLKAHAILLKLDARDFRGNVTFCFKQDDGISACKIEEIVRFNCHEKGSDIDLSSDLI